MWGGVLVASHMRWYICRGEVSARLTHQSLSNTKGEISNDYRVKNNPM